jgi:hypothetical protein
MSQSQQIIALSDKDPKVMGYNEEAIYLSSKSHKTFEALQASSVKSGFLETTKTIPVSGIRSIHYNEADAVLKIGYQLNEKDKKGSYTLEEASVREGMARELAQYRGLKESTREESKVKPLLWNLLWLATTAFFTIMARNLALGAEKGEHYQASGRRSGLTQLLVNLVESAGATPVTIIGVLIFAYLFYSTYKRYQNPAKEVLFE